MKKIQFIFFDAGGGHRSAANALRMVIEQQKRPWQIELVNLQELLDPLDIFRKVTGLRLQDIYNQMLKRGWTLGSPQLTFWMHVIIRLYLPKQVAILEKFWREAQPDLVVSLVPNFNRALGESLRRARPRTPFVTVLTDIADYPPHFWIERQKQILICGSDKAVEQARAMGYSEDRVFRVSGMILHPKFYERVELDRAAERGKLGLDAELPTGLVLFGGEGSEVMAEIAAALDRSGLDLQLILICGRNAKLANRLRARPTRIRKFVEGFTTEVPHYMRLSDFFIGKPGPGSISEALAMNLPVIVERNAWTLPQERYNSDWIREHGVGLVVRSFRREIGPAVATLLEPQSFERFRANTAKLHNRAVFEIPDILEGLLGKET